MDPVTISMLVSAGVGAVQAYNAYADQKEAQKDAQRLGAQLRAIQEADKVSGLQLATLGAELTRQAVGQQMAQTMNALTGAGAEGVLGGVPGAQAVAANSALQLAADLQQQEYERNRFVVQQQQALEGRRTMTERELIGDQLTGAQAQEYAKGTEKNMAIASTLGAIGQGAAAEVKAQDLYKKTPVETNKKVFTPTNELVSKQLPTSVAPPDTSQRITLPTNRQQNVFVPIDELQGAQLGMTPSLSGMTAVQALMGNQQNVFTPINQLQGAQLPTSAPMPNMVMQPITLNNPRTKLTQKQMSEAAALGFGGFPYFGQF